MEANVIQIQERLRWGQVPRLVLEELLCLLLLLVPRCICVEWVRHRIATRIYGGTTKNVFLYKSGRAALRGLMEGLQRADSRRQVAYVPDYVCNVVGAACRAAGYKTVEYPTDEKCLPRWKELEDLVRADVAPVVVLCSLFGSVPADTPEAEAFMNASPKVFIVADECQNFVPNPAVKPLQNRAVVFSFNNKTCPGLMGGGVACLAGADFSPVFVKGDFQKRVLCFVALLWQWGVRIWQNGCHLIRLFLRRSVKYRVPAKFEFSTCRQPHFDLVAEPIFKLSVARAWVSLLFLESYQRIRKENSMAFCSAFGEKIGFGIKTIRSGPPFLEAGLGKWPDFLPVPVKAPYGSSGDKAMSMRHSISLKTNTPFVRYKVSHFAIAQTTSRHSITDNRILHCMAKTAEMAGYQSVVVGPAREDGCCDAVSLRACPVIHEGRRPFLAGVWVRLLVNAIKSKLQLFQLHDPDLLPVGILLKLFGRKVIYDIHDDYEASFKDRLRNRGWLGRWVPKIWWWFERNAVRAFDGVVVADRHLAAKFAHVQPVILGNFPRLNFTPPASADGEETFNLIYVGGVSRERGMGMALEALRRLPQPNIRLHIIGAGWETDLIDQLKAEPRVILHGRVAWTELHKHYVKAHVGLALYQPLDSFLYYPGENAVKVIEYMAAGIPTLCSDFSGLKKFVEDSGCGLVVRPDDPDAIAAKIQQLYSDADLRKKLGAMGRQLFETEYNWEKHEPALVGLYQKVLAS